jgi:hypothetical protein
MLVVFGVKCGRWLFYPPFRCPAFSALCYLLHLWSRCRLLRLSVCRALAAPYSRPSALWGRPT